MTKPGRGDGEGPCPHGAVVHGPVGGEDIDNLIGSLGRALPRIIIIQGVTGNHALPGKTNDSIDGQSGWKNVNLLSPWGPMGLRRNGFPYDTPPPEADPWRTLSKASIAILISIP